jgi:hypothetical protein
MGLCVLDGAYTQSNGAKIVLKRASGFVIVWLSDGSMNNCRVKHTWKAGIWRKVRAWRKAGALHTDPCASSEHNDVLHTAACYFQEGMPCVITMLEGGTQRTACSLDRHTISSE